MKIAQPKNRGQVALVLPFYGIWPIWFPAFLRSCGCNQSVDWLIVSDLDLPGSAPPNVRKVEMTFDEVRSRARATLGADVSIETPYKLCDIRPMFGEMFGDYLADYEFWGHCDMDVIWGDISAFVTDDLLCNHDVISSRQGKIAGHFSLFRNTPELNALYRRDTRYCGFLDRPEPMFFDEVGMTKLLQEHGASLGIRIYWPSFLLNFPDSVSRKRKRGPSDLPALTNRWEWAKGKLYFDEGQRKSEVMYLHFMTWKKSISYCGFDYGDRPERFLISYSHIGLSETDRPPGSILSSLRRRWQVARA